MVPTVRQAMSGSQTHLAALLRGALRGDLGEVYAQLGGLVGRHWPDGSVQVWAAAPGADLLQWRWSSDGRPPKSPPDDKELESLALEPDQRAWETAAGYWLPVRCDGLLVALVELRGGSPPGGPIPEEVLELPALAGLALTHLFKMRLHSHLAGLRPDLQGLNPKERMHAVLKFALCLLGCEEGNVAILQNRDRDWLKVIAAEGPRKDCVFDLMPATFRQVQEMLGKQLPVVVSPVRPFPESKHLAPVVTQLKGRYGRHSQHYLELLLEVKSCVLVPLWDVEGIVGVLTLQWLTHQAFQPEQVVDLTLLVQEIRAMVNGLSGTAATEDRLPHTPQQLLQRFAHRNPADLPDLLCQDLSVQARRIADCYRTAVTLRLGDEPALTVTNLYPRNYWPRDFQNYKLAFNGSPAATVRAYLSGNTYAIPDLREKEICYIRVPEDDERVKAMAAIPMRAGERCVGALALDWDQLAAFDEELLKKLQMLADLYAQALVLVNFGAHWNDLEQLLQAASDKPDWLAILKLLASATGAEAGALFLSRPGQHDRIFREATLRKLDEHAPDEAWYDVGEGLTGWIFKNNRALKLERLDRPELLVAIAPDLKLAAKFHDCAKTNENEASPFLGLPLAVGNEVLGVVRLRRTSRPFSTMEEFLAQALVSRLAAFLQRQAGDRRERVLSALRHDLLPLNNRTDILEAMLRAVEQELGKSHVLLRGVEVIKEAEHLVALYANSQTVRDTSPPALKKYESVSGWAWGHLRPLLVNNMRDPAQTRELNLVVPLDKEPWRTVLSLPLQVRDKFLGALVFMSDHVGVYSESDVKFLEAVAAETAAGFARAQDHDRAKLASDLYRLAARFPYDLVKPGAERQQLEFDLYVALMQTAAPTLGSQHYWVALSRSEPEFLTLFRANGEQLQEYEPPDGSPCLPIPRLPVKRLESHLSGLPYLILDVEGAKRLYRELSGELRQPTALEAMEQVLHGTRLLVLPLWSDSHLRALFIFLIPELFWLCHGVADRVAEVLKDIDNMLRLADGYERERTVSNNRLLLSLLGGAANYLRHQIKEPIFLMRLTLENLLAEEDPEEMRKLAQQAMQNVKKFEMATQQFVGFARQFLDDPQPTDLARVLQEAVDEAAVKSGRCVLDFADDPPVRIVGYHEPLVTAFHHLWTNANRAVEKKKDGCVTLRLSSRPDVCVVEVVDNGVGMDADTLRRAFIPFFSRYASSGLGLPAAQSVVHAHRGQIGLTSQLGEGTTATITLPRSVS